MLQVWNEVCLLETCWGSYDAVVEVFGTPMRFMLCKYTPYVAMESIVRFSLMHTRIDPEVKHLILDDLRASQFPPIIQEHRRLSMANACRQDRGSCVNTSDLIALTIGAHRVDRLLEAAA